jgi:myo-inositol-hexaphosphate 3-phosphohydrolase
VVAEEYSEAYTKRRISNIAAEIRSADDYNHPIAVHQTGGLLFDFPDEPNIDQFAIQYGANSPKELHNAIVTVWNNAAGRYNINLAESSLPTGTLDRKSKWAVAMGGAYVMIFGMDIEKTPISDLEDCGRLVSFMTSTNFNQMSPHDELKYAGTEYVLALPGESYIAYSSSLPESGMIGLKNMVAGRYGFKWFDPANGTTVTQKTVTVAPGNQSWVKPSTIGTEVAVYIKRVDVAASPLNKDLTSPRTAIDKDFRYDDSLRWTEDSLAIWVAPNPNDSLLFITHKRGKVDVWNLKTNKIVKTLTGFKSTNGVAVDQLENAFYVTDPRDGVIKKYFVSDLISGNLEPALTFGRSFPKAPNPMGITVYHDAGSFIYVTYNSKGAIGLSESFVRVFKSDGTFVRDWSVGKVELESIKADDHNKVILVADESNNFVKVYSPDGVFVQNFGEGAFGGKSPDAEGIDIYECNDDGYIIVSNQKVNQFEIFNRKTYQNLARFRINTALDTDGIALTQASLFNYPKGGFFAQSNNAYVEGVSWSKIASATGMTLCMNGVLGP